MIRITALEASQKFNAKLVGDANFLIEGVSDPRLAQRNSACFVASPEYLPAVGQSPAGCWVIDPQLFNQLEEALKNKKVFLLTEKPYYLFTNLMAHFFPTPQAKAGVSPQAFVSSSARVDPTAQIDPFVYIGEKAEVGQGVILHSHVMIGDGAKIGAHSLLHSGVKVYSNCEVGSRNVLHSGVVIGSDGFGFVNQEGSQAKIPQVGRAILHDDVEIGANSTVDRGTLDDTIIGAGTKIDNLVQIGHNCKLGKNVILCAFVGLSGNTIVGDNVLIAGQAGTKGHIKIGDNVQIGAQSGVSKDIPSNSSVKGYPPQPLKDYLKNQALFVKLPEIYKRLVALEKKLSAGEE